MVSKGENRAFYAQIEGKSMLEKLFHYFWRNFFFLVWSDGSFEVRDTRLLINKQNQGHLYK